MPRLSYYTGMTDATNLTSVHNPEQAIHEFVGGQFISWLAETIRHVVSNWPVMEQIAAAHPPAQQLRKFLTQLFLIQQAMWSERDTDPGFLKFAIANLSESNDPAAESALAVLETKFNPAIGEHLKTLWLKLFHSLGLSQEELMRLEPKESTRNYIAELSELYSTAEWQTGVGALVSYWILIGPKFQAIYALARQLENFSEKEFEILKLLANYEPQGLSLAHELLEKLSFDPTTKQLIWEGVIRQLGVEQEFLEHTAKYLE